MAEKGSLPLCSCVPGSSGTLPAGGACIACSHEPQMYYDPSNLSELSHASLQPWL